MIGRIITGLAVGLYSSTIFLYSAELSPPHIRGKLATCNQLMVCVGILLGFVVDKYIVDWRHALASGIPVAALLCLCFVFVTPRSPRWLVKKGR